MGFPKNLVDSSTQIATIPAAPIHLLKESVVHLPGLLSRVLFVEKRGHLRCFLPFSQIRTPLAFADFR
jgi:hypothetical protein